MPVLRSARSRGDASISGGDDNIVPIATRAAQHSPLKKKQSTVRGGEAQVLEISSEDERARNLPSKNQLKQLQQEIRALQRKCAKLEKVEGQLDQARKEIGELKRSRQSFCDATQFEDLINCEICTMTMLKPYVLGGCGHSFCVSCLAEWFGTILAQHMTEYPDWSSPVPPFLHLVGPRLRTDPHVAAIIARNGPQPEYSCPTCRAPVATKPVEHYILKALIHTVAANTNLSIPKNAVKRQGKGKAKTVAEGPFDGFFGKDT